MSTHCPRHVCARHAYVDRARSTPTPEFTSSGLRAWAVILGRHARRPLGRDPETGGRHEHRPLSSKKKFDWGASRDGTLSGRTSSPVHHAHRADEEEGVTAIRAFAFLEGRTRESAPSGARGQRPIGPPTAWVAEDIADGATTSVRLHRACGDLHRSRRCHFGPPIFARGACSSRRGAEHGFGSTATPLAGPHHGERVQSAKELAARSPDLAQYCALLERLRVVMLDEARSDAFSLVSRANRQICAEALRPSAIRPVASALLNWRARAKSAHHASGPPERELQRSSEISRPRRQRPNFVRVSVGAYVLSTCREAFPSCRGLGRARVSNRVAFWLGGDVHGRSYRLSSSQGRNVAAIDDAADIEAADRRTGRRAPGERGARNRRRLHPRPAAAGSGKLSHRKGRCLGSSSSPLRALVWQPRAGARVDARGPRAARHAPRDDQRGRRRRRFHASRGDTGHDLGPAHVQTLGGFSRRRGASRQGAPLYELSDLRRARAEEGAARADGVHLAGGRRWNRAEEALYSAFVARFHDLARRRARRRTATKSPPVERTTCSTIHGWRRRGAPDGLKMTGRADTQYYRRAISRGSDAPTLRPQRVLSGEGVGLRAVKPPATILALPVPSKCTRVERALQVQRFFTRSLGAVHSATAAHFEEDEAIRAQVLAARAASRRRLATLRSGSCSSIPKRKNAARVLRRRGQPTAASRQALL